MGDAELQARKRKGSIMHGETPYSVGIWRWLHPGRDPLVRTGDRLEAQLILVLVGAGLALPVAASVGSGPTPGGRHWRRSRPPSTTNSYLHSRSGHGEARQDRPHLTVPVPPT
ncbi:MAG: hypothetical protein ACRDRM_04135 [Pseudonocardiaceae bacterium]